MTRFIYNKVMCRFFFFLCFFSMFSFSEETKESFVITIDHGRLKIISPAVVKKNVGIIIENKTMNTLHAKIRTDEKNISSFAISPSFSKSIEITFEKNKRVYFVPMSPPFSEIELIPGREVYEIPPRK